MLTALSQLCFYGTLIPFATIGLALYLYLKVKVTWWKVALATTGVVVLVFATWGLIFAKGIELYMKHNGDLNKVHYFIANSSFGWAIVAFVVATPIFLGGALTIYVTMAHRYFTNKK